MTERRTVTGLALSWSHILITAVVWLLTIGMLYAGLKDNAAEDRRRIQGLEEKSVDRHEFEDLKTQMRRIEDKLDADLKRH